MTSPKLISALGVVAFLSACGATHSAAQVHEAWDGYNDPEHLSTTYTRNLNALPRTGESYRHPWSDTYWPSKDGGIAVRWYGANPQSGFYYQSPSEEDARHMSAAAMRLLSPAEKYDIYMGHFDYPTVKMERRLTRPSSASWEGLCHGWSAAAILYAEPRPVSMRGPSGISVPFGSSDIKALLTFYEAQVRKNAGSSFLAQRCNVDLEANPEAGRNNPACKGVNAGSFHLVLTNELGVNHRSFVLDVARGIEVWNQPVVSFVSQKMGQHAPSFGAAPGTVSEITYQTTVRYAQEIDPEWNAVAGTEGQVEAEKVYNYRVELDRSGEIIGGEWLQNDRPEFLWSPGTTGFQGYWSGLADLARE